MFSLVGNRNGRKIIRWGYVVLAALLLTFIAGPVAAGLYALLARSWNSYVLLVGPAVGLVATLLTLVLSLLTPLQRLPMIR